MNDQQSSRALLWVCLIFLAFVVSGLAQRSLRPEGVFDTRHHSQQWRSP
jgi:hypothetical protein